MVLMEKQTVSLFGCTARLVPKTCSLEIQDQMRKKGAGQAYRVFTELHLCKHVDPLLGKDRNQQSG